MNWEEFEGLVEKADLQPINCGRGHWQIKGGTFTVNYYPSRGTIYVNGTHSDKRIRLIGGPKDAIKAATSIPRRKPRHAKANRWSKRQVIKIRRQLLKRDPHCHWCGHRVQEIYGDASNKATLEHVIPLDRGGSNGPDNLVLACKECNDKRGHDMPELEGKL